MKMVDFGITHVEYSTLTQDDAVLDTPSYMSPEQICGTTVDGLSDIFLRGIIVDEMAAGNRLFLGESLATISNRVLSQMPLGVADSGFRSQSVNVTGVECRVGAGRMQQKMLDTVFFP